MVEIIETLNSSADWSADFDAPDETRSEQIATSWQQELPRDFEAILRTFGGGELANETPLTFMTLSQLMFDWDTDHRMDALPGAIVFAHDNGGAFYYFDTRNHLGYGKWAVFLVRMADKDKGGSIYVGKNVSEAIEAVLSGEDLFDRPELGMAKP